MSTRIYVEPLGAATTLVLDGTCTLGLLALLERASVAVRVSALARVALLPVVAPGHPLAADQPPILAERLREPTQLVLTDRSRRSGGRDHGVPSTRTWRLGDLGAKQALLLARLGWGNMPQPMVAADVRRDRLRAIRPRPWDGSGGRVRLPMHLADRADHPLLPAAAWMIRCLLGKPAGA